MDYKSLRARQRLTRNDPKYRRTIKEWLNGSEGWGRIARGTKCKTASDTV